MVLVEPPLVRVGLDVLDRHELDRLLLRPWFLRFVFSEAEIAAAEAMTGERRREFLAGRFAAKEAVLKALGKGLLNGVAPREIDVARAADGAPDVHLSGRAAQLARGPITLSIAHKQDIVTAVAIVVQPAFSPPVRTD